MDRSEEFGWRQGVPSEMDKAEDMKQKAKRTDVIFKNSSFLPDEPVYVFTETELTKYVETKIQKILSGIVHQ